MIDRPIKPLVDEFQRIGLKTKFSCCGYTYKAQEEDKGHTKWAYIIFYPIHKDNFFRLSNNLNRWLLRKTEGKDEWMISYQPTESVFTDNPKHYYEPYVIAINGLLETLKEFESFPVEYEDGNKSYMTTDYLKNEWIIKEEQC